MVKLILYMAISADGYIAKEDGDSNWVSETDAKIFEKKVKEIGCIIVGRRTFDQYYGEIYPIEGITNIVLTHDTSRKGKNKNVIFATSPKEALKIVKEKGYNKALLVGGGHINGAFLKDNLIDEIFLSVHPLILGKGIKLFENLNQESNLKLIDAKVIEGELVQLHYRVIK